MSRMKAFLEDVTALLPEKDDIYCQVVANALLERDRDIIRCLHCGDTIVSMHRHDFRWCSCQSVAIDGGKDYTKVTYKPNSKYIFPTDINQLQATLVGPRDQRDDL